ncbi:MAG: NrfD/PsrC family molybdoenzyme membrane anchor subunit, partial [Chloroflexota bacterium]
MTVTLEKTLEKTGNRASLASEYVIGYAPEAQRKDQHVTPGKPTYYDIPPIKSPEWLWYIPAYFYVGGIASGAYIVAVLADMRGRREELPFVRAGHFVSLAAAAISPVLLILDLGKPERWYNMLRVFRPRSMMNLGTYILSFMGAFGVAGAISQLLRMLGPNRLLYRLAMQPLRLFSWLGAIPAGFLGSYTAFLLAATNVPLWAGNRLLMGLLFFSSALSTGLSATHLAAGLFGSLTEASKRRIKRAENQILGVELAVTVASGLALRGLARPLVTGRLGLAYLLGSVGLGMLAPLGLNRLGKTSGLMGMLPPLLTLLGGAAMRLAIHEAGKRSA